MAAGVARRAGALLACLGLLAACVTNGGPSPGKQPASSTLISVPTRDAEVVEPRFAVSTSGDGRTVEFLGTLSEAAGSRLAAALKAPGVTTLRLTSTGGLGEVARALADLVARRGIDTYVPLYCASGCAEIFLAGRTRAMAPAARLGFHRGESLPEPQPERDAALNAAWAERMRQAGVSEAFIARVLATPHGEMWIVSHAELASAGLVIAAQPDMPQPPLLSDPLALIDYVRLNDPVVVALTLADPAAATALRPLALAALRGDAAAQGRFTAALFGALDSALARAKPLASDESLRFFYTVQRDILTAKHAADPARCRVTSTPKELTRLLGPLRASALSERLNDARVLMLLSAARQPFDLAGQRAALEREWDAFYQELYRSGRISARDNAMLDDLDAEANAGRACAVILIIWDAVLSAPDAGRLLRGMAL
jgi:hypothetical protein